MTQRPYLIATLSRWPDIGRVRDAGNESIFFGAVFLSRRLRDRIGLLSEEKINSGDDVDMTMRSRRAGLRNIIDGRCAVTHAGGGTRLRSGMLSADPDAVGGVRMV